MDYNKDVKFWWIDDYNRHGFVEVGQTLSVKEGVSVITYDNEQDYINELENRNIDYGTIQDNIITD